jgi:hypothetical protein
MNVVKISKKTVDVFKKAHRIPAYPIGVWCNGNTGDSDSLVRGSNPCTPTSSRAFPLGFFYSSPQFLLAASPPLIKKSPVSKRDGAIESKESFHKSNFHQAAVYKSVFLHH